MEADVAEGAAPGGGAQDEGGSPQEQPVEEVDPRTAGCAALGADQPGSGGAAPEHPELARSGSAAEPEEADPAPAPPEALAELMATCPFGPLHFVVWIRPEVLADAQHWVRREGTHTGGAWHGDVLAGIFQECPLGDISLVSWVFRCPRLVFMDISHCELVSAGDEAMWDSAPCLQTLWLHGNRIQELEALQGLGALQELRCLSLHDNPLQGYRRHVATALPGLALLDDYIIADAERCASTLGASARPSLFGSSSTQVGPRSVFRPLTETLRVPMSRPGPEETSLLPAWEDVADKAWGQREEIVLTQIYAKVRHVERLAAALNPSCAIQRVWRGYRARREWRPKIRRARRMTHSYRPTNVPEVVSQGAPVVAPASAPAPLDGDRAAERIQAGWRGHAARCEVIAHACQVTGLTQCLVPAAQLHLLDTLLPGSTLREITVGVPSRYCVLRMPPTWERTERKRVFPLLRRSSATLRQVEAARWGPPQTSKLLRGQPQEVLARRAACLRAVLSQGEAAELRQRATLRAVRRPGLAQAPATAALHSVTASPEAMTVLVMCAARHNRATRESGRGHALALFFLPDAERITAAVTIQAAWRGAAGRSAAAERFGMRLCSHADGATRRFSALRLQAVWRACLARRRAAFLARMRAVVNFAAARGTAPPRPQTEACLALHAYQQLLRRPRGGLLRCCREHHALRTGVILAAEHPRGQCVSLRDASLRELPRWLRHHMANNAAPVAATVQAPPDDAAPEILPLLLSGAQIAHAAVPSNRSFITLLVTPELDELKRYAYGYLCLRYCSREEALRRGLLLAALTWDPRSSTMLCFEPPAVIVHSDAAQLIQSWWLTLRQLRRARGTAAESAQRRRGRRGSSRADTPDSAAANASSHPSRPASALGRGAPLRDHLCASPAPRSTDAEVELRLAGASGPRSLRVSYHLLVTQRLTPSASSTPRGWFARTSQFGRSPRLPESIARGLHPERLLRGREPFELRGRQAFCYGDSDLHVAIAERQRDRARTAHRDALEAAKLRRAEEAEALRQLVQRRKQEAGALWKAMYDGANSEGEGADAAGSPTSGEADTGVRLQAVVATGAPRPSDLNAPQVRLSAVLRRFADQALRLERSQELAPHNADEAVAEYAAQPDDIPLSAEDLKWLSARDLGTLVRAKEARHMVRVRAETGIRRALRSTSQKRAVERRREAREAAAQRAAFERQERNKTLWTRWRDAVDEREQMLLDRHKDNGRKMVVQNKRAEALSFLLRHNVVEQQMRRRRLAQLRGNETASAVRRARQLISDRQERRIRLNQWREGELELRRAMATLGQEQLERAVRNQRKQQLDERQSEYHTAKQVKEQRRRALMERYQAVVAEGDAATGRWQKPSVFGMPEPDVSCVSPASSPRLPRAAFPPQFVPGAQTPTAAQPAAAGGSPTQLKGTPPPAPPAKPVGGPAGLLAAIRQAAARGPEAERPHTARNAAPAPSAAQQGQPLTARPLSAAVPQHPDHSRSMRVTGRPPGIPAVTNANLVIPVPPAQPKRPA
eukprot:TRINITY_DN50791_c0_g1_i1.p1 TRINITY_DN50791_c0_g1~~TRINITY_DN50791_c0_g1_i1.p1  ORF type:complete len:1553 (+),score=350.22 TRINITY_DN50791_c0_g1_i1:75-4661(+)